MDVWFGTVGAGGVFTRDTEVTLANADREILSTSFSTTDEIALVVSQSEGGACDNNWVDEMIELKLAVGGQASVSPDIYALMVDDRNVAPVATFQQRSFALTENATRDVSLDIVTGKRGTGCPRRRVGHRRECC